MTRRSESGIWYPSLRSPALNSSNVSLPFLFTSILSNICFMSAASSTDRCSAITCRCLRIKLSYFRMHFLCKKNYIYQFLSNREAGNFFYQHAVNPTLSAFFFNLFIAANCCSLARTASPREMSGIFLESCNHGCSVHSIDIARKAMTE